MAKVTVAMSGLTMLDQVVDRLDLGVQRFITSDGDLGGGVGGEQESQEV